MRSLAVAALLPLLLALGWYVYAPGLSGGFLFDDDANLSALGAYGPIDDIGAVTRYLTGGRADPTGRPVALATFLLDAQDWPADPAPFKRTNLLLHVLNGALLTWLTLLLSRAASLPEARAQGVAVLTAAIWMLHPLFVSTTLYVVQRQAMLPGTFILVALIGFCRTRARMRLPDGWRPSAVAAAWIVGGTLFATLSKANGALLPLLALVLDKTIFAGHEAPAHWKRTRLAVLVLPALAILFYLLTRIIGAEHSETSIRPWSLWQRVLTQPRVLWDYLRLLWLPTPFTSALFNDDFPASTDLWRPWTTLPSLAALVALGITAFKLRRAQPMLSAGFLFYLAGHALESTTIPLELYFEHRNYVPALLLFWPLAEWLLRPGSLQRLRTTLAFCVPAGLAVMTYNHAALWGNDYEQALLWAELNPSSARAQTYASHLEKKHGRPAAAEARLRRALAMRTHDAQLALNLLDVRCGEGGVEAADLHVGIESIRLTRTGADLVLRWLDEAIERGPAACSGLDDRALRALIAAGWQNAVVAKDPVRRQYLRYLEGKLAMLEGDAAGALASFNAGLAERVRPDLALEQAAMLGGQGHPCEGLAHLKHYDRLAPQRSHPRGGIRRVEEWTLQRSDYWHHEFEHMQNTLLEDVRRTGPCATP